MSWRLYKAYCMTARAKPQIVNIYLIIKQHNYFYGQLQARQTRSNSGGLQRANQDSTKGGLQ